ncbi:hypothetical protein EDB82DRAFT_163410 [Fusarium venenatum]|uniref:uncharacterized protein n=1 Tax=Fusarium venenatum TaxID=56646 RepID=UPI001D60ECAA|nr:hypothetical protein EDB82DRAFT_163410 [Fusarium venenatum]
MSTPTTDPLVGLHCINWSQFTDAYSLAYAVPISLRELQSTDPDAYLTALDECWSRICHQATHYSASVKAIPISVFFDRPSGHQKPTQSSVSFH